MQRKSTSDKPAPPKPKSKKGGSRNSETSSPALIPLENEGDDSLQNSDSQHRSKRPKRPTKSVNENLEPAFVASPSLAD